jgi:hypothetical protein
LARLLCIPARSSDYEAFIRNDPARGEPGESFFFDLVLTDTNRSADLFLLIRKICAIR